MAALVNSLDDRGGLMKDQDAKLMIRRSCGPLLEILRDETVQVIHHSLTEFLLDGDRSSANEDNKDDKWFPAFTPSLVHRSLTLLCIDYLQSGCFESWPVEKEDDDFSKGSEQQKDLMLRFHFLQYASENLLYHPVKCDGLDLELFRKYDEVFKYGSHVYESWKHFAYEMTCELRPLHMAGQAGLSAYTAYLLEMGDLPDCTDSYGRSPAIHAAMHGQSKTLALLLKSGASHNIYDLNGLSPIHYAAKGNYVEALQVLLEAGADPMSPKIKKDNFYAAWRCPTIGMTPIQYACESGSIEAILILLQYMDPQARSTVLPHWASAKGQSRAIPVLLRDPAILANLNKKDKYGKTAIYLAASIRDSATVRELLDHGASVHVRSDVLVDQRDRRDQSKVLTTRHEDVLTPLHGWAHFRREDGCIDPNRSIQEMENVATLLIEARCDIESKSLDGKTVLFEWHNQVTRLTEVDLAEHFVAVLLKYGADPCATDSKGNTPLHQSLGWMNVKKIFEMLVKAGADINAVRYEDGATPLIAAARAQYLDVRAFIDNGADPDMQDLNGDTALHCICSSWCLELSHIKEWLTFANPAIKNNTGQTCLYNLRWGNRGIGRTKAIPFLMEKGLDIESRDYQGWTALLAACARGELPIITALLENGADAKSKDFQNKSGLHLIATATLSNIDNGLQDMNVLLKAINIFIEREVDINDVDFDGNTAFHEAVKSDDYFAKVEIRLMSIMRAGVLANKKNNRGRTALHIAAGGKASEVDPCSEGRYASRIDFLLQKNLGIDVNARDHAGLMAIHVAVSTSQINTWKLIQAGADIQAKTLSGRTPLHFAAEAAQSTVVSMLCERYVKNSWSVNDKDQNGRTPLHEAALSGSSECVYFLLQSGADPNVKDRYGHCPLHSAAGHYIDMANLKRKCKYQQPPYSEGAFEFDGKKRLIPFTNLGRSYSNSPPLAERLSLVIFSEEEACMVQDVIRLLIEAGADLSSRDRSKQTPYDLVVFLGSEHAVDLLRPDKNDIDLEAELHNPLADQVLTARNKYAPDIVQATNIEERDDYKLLETAIYLKNESILRALLQDGIDPTARGPDGLTAVHTIAYWGHISLMKIIVSHVRDLNIFSPPLLHVAASRELSNLQMIQYLLEKGVNVNTVYTELDVASRRSTGAPIPSYTLLHVFAIGEQWWHISALKSLCEAGGDPEIRDVDGRTALQCALTGRRSGSFATGFWRDQTLEVLLDHGVDVNAASMQLTLSSTQTSTALITALEAGRALPLIQKLLDCGADINLGEVPALFAAIDKGDAQVVEAIIEAGADVNTTYQSVSRRFDGRGPEVEVPLLSASCENPEGMIGKKDKERRAEIISILLRHGANPLMGIKDGSTTVLHEIAHWGGVVTPILEDGIDMEVRDDHGRSPLLVACSPFTDYRIKSKAQDFILAGADVNAIDDSGSTALHLACQADLEEVITLLLDKGASISAKDHAGLTPLYYSLTKSHTYRKPKTSNLLLSAGAGPLVTGPEGETALHLLAPLLMRLSPADNAYAPERQSSLNDRTDYLAEYRELYQRFVDAGCDRESRDSSGNTPLFPYVTTVTQYNDYYGTDYRIEEDITMMLDQHDVFAVNNDGDTLLHAVCGRMNDGEEIGEKEDRKSVLLFKLLIAKGLDPRKENKKGLSALDVAAACGKNDILGMFGKED